MNWLKRLFITAPDAPPEPGVDLSFATVTSVPQEEHLEALRRAECAEREVEKLRALVVRAYKIEDLAKDIISRMAEGREAK